jgi:hypothetical protein
VISRLKDIGFVGEVVQSTYDTDILKEKTNATEEN